MRSRQAAAQRDRSRPRAAAQRGGEVEAEPVHAGAQRPGAQRVHAPAAAPAGGRAPAYCRSRCRRRSVTGSSGRQPVVAGVVEAAQRQRRARARRSRRCGSARHRAARRCPPPAARRPRRAPPPSRRAPGAGPAPGAPPGCSPSSWTARAAAGARSSIQAAHGHQFDRGDPEPAQVLDRRRMRQRREGAAQRRRDARVAHGEAAHVQLVDHLPVPGEGGGAGGRRGAAAHHDAFRHRRRAVGGLGPSADRTALGWSRNGRSIAAANGSSSSLAGLNRWPRARIPRPEARAARSGRRRQRRRYGRGTRRRCAPAAGSAPILGVLGIEQAERDRLGMGREHRHVDALPSGQTPSGSGAPGPTGPDVMRARPRAGGSWFPATAAACTDSVPTRRPRVGPPS